MSSAWGIGVCAVCVALFVACDKDDPNQLIGGNPTGCDAATEPQCPGGPASCVGEQWSCAADCPDEGEAEDCFDACGDLVAPTCVDGSWMCDPPGTGGCGGAGGMGGAGGTAGGGGVGGEGGLGGLGGAGGDAGGLGGGGGTGGA
jgi:hypothetical protein